jgi:NAD(P)-dependent dehydrogenase (short-subunit alcohol dehydrogenase family)
MEIERTTALVTGGASGLGAATATALQRAGAKVFVLDLESQRDKAPADDGIAFIAGDVTDPAGVEQAVTTANADGSLRIVVNCAGVVVAGRTVDRNGPHDLELFRRALTVNLLGTFNVTRLAAAAIQANEPLGEERGVIVNTASVAAYDGQIGQVAYAASKAGIAGMTLPIARDLARSLIRCVAIAPGIFETPLLAGIREPERQALAAAVPHPNRLGHPDEYAALALHIVRNPMLNGETIRLDGALRMAPR